MFRFSLAVLAGLLSAQVAAQTIDCANTMAQQELNQCAYADWQAADGTLNDVYRQATALLKGWDADLPFNLRGGANALRDAQRAWITFRDKACEAEGFAMRGGTAEPLVVYGCMRQLTLDRTDQLQAMLDTFGG
jgi:uncharacterized protein YecT (DUF1311 family)